MKGISPTLVDRARQLHSVLSGNHDYRHTGNIAVGNQPATLERSPLPPRTETGNGLAEQARRARDDPPRRDRSSLIQTLAQLGGSASTSTVPLLASSPPNGPVGPSSTSDPTCATAADVPVPAAAAARVHEIGLAEGPSPGLCNSSVVYVLLSEAGVVKVGETDDLAARLHTHRAVRPRQWTDTFVLKVDGKSVARRVETAVLHALRRDGWPLDSETDAQHTAFGTKR